MVASAECRENRGPARAARWLRLSSAPPADDTSTTASAGECVKRKLGRPTGGLVYAVDDAAAPCTSVVHSMHDRRARGCLAVVYPMAEEKWGSHRGGVAEKKARLIIGDKRARKQFHCACGCADLSAQTCTTDTRCRRRKAEPRSLRSLYER